ncbi:hypothetical protein CDL15_Pgr012950 [Punica granatum]|uniref:Uncharacterized protein n=1 Tax=Punica granatum TaxID=22663 RepID=A0A218XFK5_PUNGR|nr:hypothetical protein CDL15_Pgr012950 [Punica granatum]PKI72323.1 hypothetical protein CRG98_007303 [Punica granatum]
MLRSWEGSTSPPLWGGLFSLPHEAGSSSPRGQGVGEIGESFPFAWQANVTPSPHKVGAYEVFVRVVQIGVESWSLSSASGSDR